MKCRVRGCHEVPACKFGDSIITCAIHSEEYKQQYNRWDIISSSPDAPKRKRSARIHRCAEKGCKEEAVVLGKDDKVYCNAHGLKFFERSLELKSQRGEQQLQRMENAALNIVLSADDN